MRVLRRHLRLLIALSFSTVLVLMMIHNHILAAGHGRIISPEDAPPARVAIVLGAAVYRSGRISSVLGQRLQCALLLYQKGKIKKILVSGNNQTRCNRESEIMRQWLIERGVSPENVQCDHAGFRTLDTCARARRVWNLNEPVLLISQKFHLPRALFLADAWGLDAHGVSADSFRPRPGRRSRLRSEIREPLARIKAWCDVYLLHCQPRYFGKPETI